MRQHTAEDGGHAAAELEHECACRYQGAAVGAEKDVGGGRKPGGEERGDFPDHFFFE